LQISCNDFFFRVLRVGSTMYIILVSMSRLDGNPRDCRDMTSLGEKLKRII
jgi:hypothetical protein